MPLLGILVLLAILYILDVIWNDGGDKMVFFGNAIFLLILLIVLWWIWREKD